MSIALDHQGTCCLIRLEGKLNVEAAAELKEVLVECQASGKDLRVDLDQAAAIDITVMQLLLAAQIEMKRDGGQIVGLISEAAAGAARDAGFDQFPGTAARK